MEGLFVDPVIDIAVLSGAPLLVERYQKHVAIRALDYHVPGLLPLHGETRQ